MEKHLYELAINLNAHLIKEGDISCKISQSDLYRINVSSSQGVMGFSGKSKQDLQSDLLNGLAFFSKDLSKYKKAVIVIAELLTDLDHYFEELEKYVQSQSIDVLQNKSLEEMLLEVFGEAVKIIRIN